MSEQSTVEGHETPLKEAVLEPQEGDKTPPSAEAENEPNLLQNLENSEAMVADNEAPICQSCGQKFTWNEQVQAFEHDDPCKAGDLEAAMNESAEPQFTVQPILGREFANLFAPTAEQLAKNVYESGKGEVIDAEFRDVDGNEPETAVEGFAGVSADKKYAIGVDYANGNDEGVMAVIKPGESGKPDELVGMFSAVGIGLQPDGSTKVVVTIQEGYWEAVQQWAEADGVEVERWLSDRLYEYISTYGEPAKGR
jgi:hypothetical protein